MVSLLWRLKSQSLVESFVHDPLTFQDPLFIRLQEVLGA